MSFDIGFTGTGQGMTGPQQHTLPGLIKIVTGRFRHGDCVGSDDQAATIAAGLGWPVRGHPPINESKRAFNAHTYAWQPPEEYLARDRAIVDFSRTLIAAPRLDREERRSGTWYTIRYASTKIETIIIWPNGKTEVRHV